MMPREVLKADNGHFVGSPRVVIDRDKDKAVVWLSSAPWGWGDCRLEFLNPASPGVRRYADKLLKRVAEAGEKERLRRERIKAAVDGLNNARNPFGGRGR